MVYIFGSVAIKIMGCEISTWRCHVDQVCPGLATVHGEVEFHQAYKKISGQKKKKLYWPSCFATRKIYYKSDAEILKK